MFHEKMSSQIVSLAWDGHYRTLLRVFEKLLENSYLVDCTIAAQGQKLKAHKEVLSAFSPYFELLFKEETENNPTIILSGINFRDLRSLVDFIYQGKLELPEDRIEDLIDAAECLQIKGLSAAHKDDSSGKINGISVSRKRLAPMCGVSHKRTRKIESEEASNTLSTEAIVKHPNYSNTFLPHRKSVNVPIAHMTGQNLMTNLVQNFPSKSDPFLIPAHSTWSSIKMGSLLYHGRSVVKPEPGTDVVENMIEPMREMSLSEGSGHSHENTDEETIIGLSGDVSVTSDKNRSAELPQDRVSPGLMNSQLCSRDFIVSSVKNELCNVSMNLPSPSVEPTVSTVDRKKLLFHSEFHVKTGPCADKTFLPECDDLIAENDDFSEDTMQNVGGPSASIGEIQVEQKDKCRSDCFGETGAHCAEEVTLRLQQLDGALVTVDGRQCNEPVVGTMSGLRAEAAEPQDASSDAAACLSHMTSLCRRDPSGPSRMDSNMRNSSTGKPYRCQLCNQTLSCSSSLKLHMRTHIGDRSHRRDIRNYAVVTYSELKEHQHIHSGSKSCEYTYLQNSSRKRYELIHNGSKLYRDKTNLSPQLVHRETPFKCTLCDYTSAYSSHLKKHLLTHSGLKPFKCSECNYETGDSINLRRHQQVHTGETSFKSTECDYSSAYSNALKAHQSSHGGLKTYKCLECDFETTSRTNMRQHYYIHSGLKPYKCPKCDYKTAHRRSLIEHQQIHNGYKSYKCHECDYAALRNSYLKRHLRNHSSNSRHLSLHGGENQ